MILLPAIDILGGEVVRLYRGRYDEVTRYSAEPTATARAFWSAGARHLHVVDLDAARGSGSNREVIGAIRRAFPGTIQVGGGVRRREDARALFELGVDRLVLGTILARDPDRVRALVEEFGTVFVAGIDAEAGRVKVQGWGEEAPLTDVELARRCRDLGLRAIVYTDIARDGTLEGANLERALEVTQASALPVILSGGVSGPDDVRRAAVSGGVRGVILGRSLYTGAVDLRALSQEFPQPEAWPW